MTAQAGVKTKATENWLLSSKNKVINVQRVISHSIRGGSPLLWEKKKQIICLAIDLARSRKSIRIDDNWSVIGESSYNNLSAICLSFLSMWLIPNSTELGTAEQNLTSKSQSFRKRTAASNKDEKM